VDQLHDRYDDDDDDDSVIIELKLKNLNKSTVLTATESVYCSNTEKRSCENNFKQYGYKM
jgi:hypothetical protein